MFPLNIFSWNTKGLNIAIKRASCLDILFRNQIQIAMLQETHLLQKDIHRLKTITIK